MAIQDYDPRNFGPYPGADNMILAALAQSSGPYPGADAVKKYAWPIARKQAAPAPAPAPAPASASPQPAPPSPQDALLRAVSALFNDKAIQDQADARVQAEIAAQAAPIQSARRAAIQQALANQAALSGLGAAAQKLMGGIGQGVQTGYNTAAEELAGLAGGFSGAVADRVRAAEQANADFVQQQAPGAGPTGQAPDAENLQDTLYALGGYIPGSSLAVQGAAARRFQETLPELQARQTQQDVQAEQARAAQEDQQYTQQLVDLAAKRPELKSQIIDELYNREAQKLQGVLSVANFAEQKREFEAGQDLQKQQLAEQKSEFGQTLSFQKQQASQQQTQWEKEFGLSNKQFNEQVKEFQKQYGLSADQAQEQVREFNVQTSQWAKQFGLSKDQFDEQVKEYAKNHQLDLKNAAEQVRQFNANFNLQVKQMAQQHGEWKSEFALNAQQIRDQRDQWQKEFDEKVDEFSKQYGIDLRQVGVQERAQDLYEQQFGFNKTVETWKHQTDVATVNINQQQVDVQRKQLAQQYKIHREDIASDVAQAVIKGQQPNASLSRLRGFLVDNSGNPILDHNGNRIKVNAKASTQDKQKLYRSAVGEAARLKGKPVENPLGVPGKYLAAPTAKGSDVFAGPSPSTNNPAKALFSGTMNFAEAQSYIVQHWGISRARARAALVAAGWKPDGKRPRASSAPSAYYPGEGQDQLARGGFPLPPTFR